LKKTVYHELPPRVEYQVTEFGNKFLAVLEQIEALQEDLNNLSR
ncbi:MAG: winged helix-turn-helix transcriptional regulator, partial [Pseudomonadota bacterium]|nr:winged helix-turn-helix transcriptional regulator [Pseudomonadota bacterium]